MTTAGAAVLPGTVRGGTVRGLWARDVLLGGD